MLAREKLLGGEAIASDAAPLTDLVLRLLEAEIEIHVMRDPTRGGLSSALNEIAAASRVGMVLDEPALPIPGPVRAACEFLGLDPLYVANEGKLVAICGAADADRLLAAMRAHPLGRAASIIGDVIEDPHHFVQMDTSFGGRRVVDWLTGEQLPRIC